LPAGAVAWCSDAIAGFGASGTGCITSQRHLKSSEQRHTHDEQFIADALLQTFGSRLLVEELTQERKIVCRHCSSHRLSPCSDRANSMAVFRHLWTRVTRIATEIVFHPARRAAHIEAMQIFSFADAEGAYLIKGVS